MVSRKMVSQHLNSYAAEFDFRYNRRAANGVNDVERAAVPLSVGVDKRLLYRNSLGA
jgi:hypothetical protein